MGNTEFELPADAASSGIETFIRRCLLHRPKRMSVPGPKSSYRIGLRMSQLQALMTWAATIQNPDIVLREEAFQSGTELSPLEIAAVRISRHAFPSTILSDRRPAAVDNALRSTTNFNSDLESKSEKSDYWLIMADYSSQAFPRLLYTPQEEVKPAQSFYVLITKAVSLAIGHLKLKVPSLRDDLRKALGTIIYELFKNTHDWARTLWNGMRIPRSIRVIHVRVLTAEDALGGRSGGLLEEFLKRQSRQCVAFVEISVLDSGPGFAQRFAGRPIDTIGPLNEEINLVKKCLRVHGSSSDDPRRGVGLHGVIQALDQVKGFLSLRTGRLSLCRPLDIHRYVESSSDLPASKPGKFNPYLMDSETQTLEPTEMPFVSGALLTAVLPLQRKL